MEGSTLLSSDGTGERERDTAVSTPGYADGREWSSARPAAHTRVRPLAPDDMPQIVDLYRRVFGSHAGASTVGVHTYLTEVFCRNPWRDEELPSLVCEAHGGRIIGSLGVMPRPMSFGGRAMRAAISHTFMVEPDHRATLAAVQLLRTFLSGPQDLSLAEGNSASQQLWEALGGTTSPLYSIRWTRLLRPGRYLLSLLRTRGLPKRWQSVLRPAAHASDIVAERLASGFRCPAVPGLHGEELTEETFRANIVRFSQGRSIRPQYAPHAVGWLFALLAQKTGRGAFRKVAVRYRHGALVGWYLYYLNRGGVSEVVQVAAGRQAMGQVLEHLFNDAWRNGSVAVSGPLDPVCASAFADRYSILHGGDGAWALAHSRRPDVLEAIHRGDAFLTRLEGEWWIA